MVSLTTWLTRTGSGSTRRSTSSTVAGCGWTASGSTSRASAGAVLVGIDSVNIDDSSPAAGGTRPAHSVLLAAGLPIVEHLRGLAALPPEGFRFTAVPPLVEGMGSFPVRAFAVLG